MKICLSSRQQKEYLKQADEIKVELRDMNSIFDLIEEYPNATIILEDELNAELNWFELIQFNILSKNKFILCTFNIKNALKAKEHGINFYLKWLINDYEMLETVTNLGVCYIRLAGNLFFDLENIKKFNLTPIRAVPNVAFEDELPRDNGVMGTWIRPEDIDLYANYIETIEFTKSDLAQERALFRIYKDNKQWGGELGLLVKDLNHEGVNRLILPEIAEKRIRCKQKCKSGGACRYCYHALKLANIELLKKVKQ